MENIAWSVIDKYFQENPYNLVAHHLIHIMLLKRFKKDI